MMMSIETRLAELKIELPSPSTPAANYVPFIKTGNLIFISGQVTHLDGKLQYVGKVGAELSLEDGYKAAKICGLNLLSHLKAACNGNLDKVTKVIKLGGFVNSAPDFTDQPKVINGASDLMVEVFGNLIGAHSRFAVSAPSLPLGSATEIDGVFEVFN